MARNKRKVSAALGRMDAWGTSQSPVLGGECVVSWATKGIWRSSVRLEMTVCKDVVRPFDIDGEMW